ncbi:MAG TPA: isochorismatase family cysteine hydrolase [Clostridiaceae bacterium]
MEINDRINKELQLIEEPDYYKIEDYSSYALFIVDMNKGFGKKGALYSDRVEGIIPDIIKLTKAFISNNSPVIAFTDSHNADSVEFNAYPTHCLKDDPESELVPEFDEYKDSIKIINKNSTNAFLENEAKAEIDNLIKRGISNFVITGCCSDICISQLSLTLKAYFNKENLNLMVIVPMDVIETYDAPWHKADIMNLFALYEMKAGGVHIVNSLIRACK